MIREEAFYLMYNIKGICYNDIVEMPPDEREWMVQRLMKQKKAEHKAYKKK